MAQRYDARKVSSLHHSIIVVVSWWVEVILRLEVEGSPLPRP